MHTSETSAIIMGAGIGGLSAALALRRIGYEVTVLERAMTSIGSTRGPA